MMAQDVIDILTSKIDTLWVIDCAILVFIMQAGFTILETGFMQSKNTIQIIMKNLGDFSVGTISFLFFGYGIIFGEYWENIIGVDSFNILKITPGSIVEAKVYAHFLFQLMFVSNFRFEDNFSDLSGYFLVCLYAKFLFREFWC